MICDKNPKRGYDDGTEHFNRADISHFYTRAINGEFVSILPNVDAELRYAHQYFGLE